MIFKKSLTASFIATVFIILLVAQSLGAIVLLLHTKSTLFESLQKRINRAADFTAKVSSGALLSHDYALIDTYLEEVMRDEDITSVYILDTNGKVVREKIKPAEADFKTINPFLYKKAMSMKIPVTLAGEKIGVVVIDYTPTTINGDISKSMTMIVLYQGIILLGVGLVMLFLFNRDIKRPVSEINRAIEKITRGDLSPDLSDLGENEIWSIANGITSLAERLSNIVSRLNLNAVNVSMAIKQVDIMYKNVIGSITKQLDTSKEIIQSVQDVNKIQSEIIIDTEKLSSFSAKNVSSLLEMKATAGDIASNTQRLYKATEDSYPVIVDITQAAKAVSKNSNEAVSALEDTSASIEEVAASIKEVKGHAEESSRLAENAKEVTEETGMLAVVDAIGGIDNISDKVKNSADIIQRLGTRSKDIEKILSVIKDVTEQTNLLSLNAAILAAQAGEYGKSFSVVADEIGALSERTANSTREIGGIVKTIQRDIRDAIDSADSVKLKVDEGNSLVVNVGKALREILDASVQSAEITKAIERATREQSVGLEQITVAIEEIRKMMKAVAISTSEQDDTLSHLLDGAAEVKAAADISKRGTEEQAIAVTAISKNLELANGRVTRINQTGISQKRINDEITTAIDQINNLEISTVKDMAEVSHSLNTLFTEMEILKKEIGVFRIE